MRKDYRFIGGHDFRERRLLSGLPDTGGFSGITCYNCGVYTVHFEKERMIHERVQRDELPQCPAFHADLFGGPLSEMKKSLRNKWRGPR